MSPGRIRTELPAHRGLREPWVIAHDFGGCVALRARLLHGARHRKLALVDQRHTDEIQPLSPTIDLPVGVRGGPPAPLTSELLAFLMA